jgi:hypothetical protein
MHRLNVFLDHYPELLLGYYLVRISGAVKNNSTQVKLFSLEDSNVVIIAHESEYINHIEIMMETAVKHELYEIAQKCVGLIEKITIEKIIDSSKHYE